MCTEQSADSQVLAHFRRVSLNRPVGQPAYRSINLGEVITQIADDLGHTLSRHEIHMSLERLKKEGTLEVPKGFIGPSCEIRLIQAAQPQLAS